MSRKISFFILIFSFIGLLVIPLETSSGQKYQLNYDSPIVTNAIVSVSSFTNFTLLNDQAEITSYNDNSTIGFYFLDNTTVNDTLTEVYLLSFAQLGNATNFSLQLLMNCSYLDLDDIASSFVSIGSFYDNDLNWVGFPGEATSPLCAVGCQDIWETARGRFISVGYPYDFEEVNATALNSTGLFNNLEINVKRNATGLYTSISHAENQTLVLEKEWLHGIWKPVNYVTLSFSTAKNSSQNVNSIWRSISGTFEFDNLTPIIPPNTSTGPKFTIPSFSFPGFTLPLTATSCFIIAIVSLLLSRPKKHARF